MKYKIVHGDILDQNVDVIVNSWNRNIIPWWLLIPQGVSGAIKKHGGVKLFRELGYRPLPLGQTRLTSAGRLPFKAIIHVAGINAFWFGTKRSATDSVSNSVKLAEKQGFVSIAMPLIGSGSGNRGQSWSLNLMCNTLDKLDSDTLVVIVRYQP